MKEFTEGVFGMEPLNERGIFALDFFFLWIGLISKSMAIK